MPRPDIWFTYHGYHKAPDLIGPKVSRCLSIPYILAEASIAGKQAVGPWASGHSETVEAVAEAAAVLAMTEVDASNLRRYVPDPSSIVLFPPFLATPVMQPSDRQQARHRIAETLDLPPDTVWLLTVAMMRPDIKRQSYELLAEAIHGLEQTKWRLLVVGDGKASIEVKGMINATAGDKVRFLGQLSAKEVSAFYTACDIYVWPALREAYGMATLEALANGLPVIACDEGGVGDLVKHGENGLLASERSSQQLSRYIDMLIGDAALRRRLSVGAAERSERLHSRVAAGERLATVLERVCRRGRSEQPSACN
jgi:glycosyltransferase involved in cell wall biosynthesis